MSVPQPSAVDINERGRSSGSFGKRRSGSDHRLASPTSAQGSVAELVEGLQLSVSSIPAYIERSDLLLVIAPGCMHADRDVACNYSTWRSRGWCRLELQAAHLKPVDMCVMVCTGADKDPFFQSTWDAWRLPDGEGEFTCCRLGHKRFDGDREGSMPCDRHQIHAVLQQMIDSKLRHLEETGQVNRFRWLASTTGVVLKGFPQMKIGCLEADATSAESPTPLQRLCTALRWTPGDDLLARSSGRSLLLYAAMSDNLEAVRSLVQGRCSVEDVNREAKFPELEFGELPLSPLFAAMAVSRFVVVEELLAATANPQQHSKANRGSDALMGAACFGNAENVRGWLHRF